MSNSGWITAASNGQRSVIFPGSTRGGLIRLQAMKPMEIKDTVFPVKRITVKIAADNQTLN